MYHPQGDYQPMYSPYTQQGMPFYDPGPQPLYHHPFQQPIPPSQISHEHPVGSQSRAMVPAEPLNDAQEVLASTAQSFVEQIDTESSILRDNPKLAQSKFLELVNALGRKEVVVQEAPITDTDEVGEGAQLVERAVGADWASDFTSREGQSANSAQSMAPIMLRSQPLSAAQWNNTQDDSSRWEEEFARMTMPDIKAGPSRRKSVHFQEQSQVVNELNLADEFDHDTFADFNGQMRQARTPRLGIGAFEAWEELQRDREELERHARTELRGMASDERYLFQNGNPFTAGAVDIDAFRQESPTIKVSLPFVSVCVEFG